MLLGKSPKWFTEYLKDTGEFESIHVTGHSLGGGLAMVTGAQAKIPAVGTYKAADRISSAYFSG